MVNENLKSFLEKSNELIKRQETEGIKASPELSRKALAALSFYVRDIPEGPSFFDRVLAGAAGAIPVRVYHPDPLKKLPVMLFLHGGGHMCGSIETYDVICRKICLSAGSILVSVDYRLAPEYPYPAGLEDCREVLERMGEILEGLNADFEKIVLCGDSGGGTFAATLAADAKNSGYPDLSGLILIYASLDYTLSSDSYSSFAKGYLLDTERIGWYFENYFQNGADRIKASPLFMSAAHLPPTLVISAGYDPLLGDSRKYRDLLNKSGVRVEYVEYPDMIHAFLFLESLVPEVVSDVYSRIGLFIKDIA